MIRSRYFLIATAVIGGALVTGCATPAIEMSRWPCAPAPQAAASDPKRVVNYRETFDPATGKVTARDTQVIEPRFPNKSKSQSAPNCAANPTLSSRDFGDVDAYLRTAGGQYDWLIKQVQDGRSIADATVMLAAVVSPTAIALGGSKDWAIVGGGAAALGTATSNYAGPQARITALLQASAATECIQSELNDQARTATVAKIATLSNNDKLTVTIADNMMDKYPNAALAVDLAGHRAILGQQQVVTKLKLRLNEIGTAPDYSTIAKDLQSKYAEAAAGVSADEEKAQGFTNETNGMAAGILKSQRAAVPDIPEKLLTQLTEYDARIAVCIAKMP